jgi:uncharacterized protein (TIGR02246 family)
MRQVESAFMQRSDKVNIRKLTLSGLLLATAWHVYVAAALQATTPGVSVHAWSDQPATADVAGVQSFFTAWDAAWKAHDPDAILRLHAADCTTVNRVARLFLDRNSLIIQMNRLQKETFKDAQFLPSKILHEKLLTPDLVIVQVAAHNPSQLPPPQPQFYDLIQTFVLKRNGDGWLAEEVDIHDWEGLPTVPGETAVFPPEDAPKH